MTPSIARDNSIYDQGRTIHISQMHSNEIYINTLYDNRIENSNLLVLVLLLHPALLLQNKQPKLIGRKGMQ
jgi:hypothetical protein